MFPAALLRFTPSRRCQPFHRLHSLPSLRSSPPSTCPKTKFRHGITSTSTGAFHSMYMSLSSALTLFQRSVGSGRSTSVVASEFRDLSFVRRILTFSTSFSRFPCRWKRCATFFGTFSVLFEFTSTLRTFLCRVRMASNAVRHLDATFHSSNAQVRAYTFTVTHTSCFSTVRHVRCVRRTSRSICLSVQLVRRGDSSHPLHF